MQSAPDADGDATATSEQSASLQRTLHDTADEIAAAKASTADSQQELSGEFGHFQIARELGRGPMGTDYLARDRQLDRDVALKIPQFNGDDQSDQIARFYREARAMATVHHPGLCPVFDVGEIDGVHYLTMAYIEGRSLDEFAKAGKPFPGLQVAALIRKLALVLDKDQNAQNNRRPTGNGVLCNKITSFCCCDSASNGIMAPVDLNLF